MDSEKYAGIGKVRAEWEREIRADEAAKAAERADAYFDKVGLVHDWNMDDLRLAITQGQSDPRDVLIDAMRRYMSAYGPGYSSTDTGPYDALKKAMEATK